jgi:hypothetical protein
VRGLELAVATVVNGTLDRPRATREQAQQNDGGAQRAQKFLRTIHRPRCR